MNKIKKAFDTVKANEELKSSTILFLQKERGRCEKRSNVSYIYRYAAAVTAAVIVLFGIGGYSMLNSPVSYISIDVNSSVELALNRFDTVVEASAYNDGGATVIADTDLKGKLYTDAIDELLSNSDFTTNIQDDEGVNFTVVSADKDRLIDGIQGCKGYRKYNGSCNEGDEKMISEAHNHKISPGKYKAYLELVEYDNSVTIEECKNMTMRQIRDMIKKYLDNDSSPETNYGGGKGNGQHHGNRQNLEENK